MSNRGDDLVFLPNGRMAGWEERVAQILADPPKGAGPVHDTSVVEPINPQHYKSHPSGVECIDVARHHDFCTGNALKYIWRAGLKGDEVQDLEKAIRYLQFRVDHLRAQRVAGGGR